MKVGRDLISRVTDAVMDDVRAWQQRPLDDVYPVMFLDALVLKVREAGTVQRRAFISRSGSRWMATGTCSGCGSRRQRAQVLDAGPNRAKAARRLRHPDLLRRRAQRVPGGDRGGLPPHGRSNVCGSPHPPQPELRAAARARAGRPRPQAGLYRRRRGRRAAGARGVRREVGQALPGDHPGVAERLGVRDPVLGIPPGSTSSDLHDG